MEIPPIVTTTAIIIFDLIIRIVLLFSVPRKRKPTAAIAWLLAIFLLPGILGFILYFIIGGTRPSRRRRKRQAIINARVLASQHAEPKHAQYSERITPFITLNQRLSKFPAVPGNSSSIHTNYLKTIAKITHDVTRARHYIYIESYIMALDNVTEPLFVAMEQAVARGVAVYVLFDAVGVRKFKRYHAMKRRMNKAGILWQEMLPVSFIPGRYSRPDLRNHRKLIAIDNEVAYIGSLNLIEPRYARKDDIIYEEMVMRMQGPIVTHTAAIIAGDWYSETAMPILHFQDFPVPEPSGKQLMQIVPSGPAYKNENNLKLFLDLIYAAKKRVVITNPYLVPGEPLITALITAAQRGVEVVILNSEAVDQWMVGHAQRSYYGELLSSGVHIYLHHAPLLLHSKHLTIDDDVAVIGSSNMDVRSFELNYECSLVIYDGKVVRQLRAVQKHNIAHSQRLTSTAWKKRSLWNSFLDSVARLTSALQ